MQLLERLANNITQAKEAGIIPLGISLGYAEMGILLREMALRFPDIDLRDPPVRFNCFCSLPIYLYDAESHIGIRMYQQSTEDDICPTS